MHIPCTCLMCFFESLNASLQPVSAAKTYIRWPAPSDFKYMNDSARNSQVANGDTDNHHETSPSLYCLSFSLCLDILCLTPGFLPSDTPRQSFKMKVVMLAVCSTFKTFARVRLRSIIWWYVYNTGNYNVLGINDNNT